MLNPRSQPSLLRGIACGFLAAGIGFALPFVAISTVFFVRSNAFDPPLFDIFVDLPLTFSGIAFSSLFGLAAILNYAPASRIGLVRAVIFVGLSLIGSVFVIGIATQVFHLGPQTYTIDPWQGLRGLIALVVPIAYTLGHTAMRFWRSPAVPSPAIADFDDSVRSHFRPGTERKDTDGICRSDDRAQEDPTSKD